MCGRFQFTAQDSAEIMGILQEVQRKFGKKAAESLRQGEITPMMKSPLLVASPDGPTPELFVWGFRTGMKPVFNACAETATKKSMFKDCVASRRCVVPATGFFEWDPYRRKHRFTFPGSQTLFMASIYDIRGSVPSYCILTTAANESVRDVHQRMPLVLEREQIEPWLSDSDRTEEFLSMTPPALDRELLDDRVMLW